MDEAVSQGSLHIQHIDPAELTPGEFVQNVRDEIVDERTTLVIIDSLNGYLNAMPEEKFLILQLHELLTFLGQRGITTILVVAQHGLMGNNVYASFDVSYLADTVLMFRIFENAGKLRQALSVSKRRAGKHDRSIRELLFQDQQGLSLSEPLENLRGIFSGIPVLETTNDRTDSQT